MSGNGHGIERGSNFDDGGMRRASWTEDWRWHLTAAVDNEGGGGILCRQQWPTVRRHRHNNQMKEEARRFPTCKALVVGRLGDVGDGAFGQSSVGRRWRVSYVGALVASNTTTNH